MNTSEEHPEKEDIYEVKSTTNAPYNPCDFLGKHAAGIAITHNNPVYTEVSEKWNLSVKAYMNVENY